MILARNHGLMPRCFMQTMDIMRKQVPSAPHTSRTPHLPHLTPVTVRMLVFVLGDINTPIFPQQGTRVELSAKNLKVMDQMPPAAPRYYQTTLSFLIFKLYLKEY